MKRRFFRFSALLAALSVLLTSLLVTVAAHRGFSVEIRREVQADATYLSAGISLYGVDYLSRMQLMPGHRITLIDPDGTVRYDSRSNPAAMENHADRPEVREALKNGEGEDTRVSTTLRDQTYYYALRLDDGSVFRMGSASASVLAVYDSLFFLVLLIVLFGCLISALISSRMTKKLIRPINEIDLDAPEQSPAYEEIVPLLSRIKRQKDQISQQTQELDRQRIHLAAITENMDEGLLVLDAEGVVLSCNKSAQRLLSIYEAHPVGLNILSLNRSNQLREAVQTATQGMSVSQVIALSGHYCQLIVSPVRSGQSMGGLILILVDVTERQEREKLRREFTANVSHELKTPLTAISGYAEIMMNGVVKPQDVPEFAQSIYQESQRLIALVRDLMFLSRLEEGVAPPMEQVNLLEIAESAVDSLRAKAESFSVQLSVSGEAVQLAGIPSVLQELLYNLLDNAIKYNRPQGSVQVTVALEEGAAVLRVQDTGIGIPKEEQGRVFERFYRVDKSHNKEIEGTGLGLAIVKHGAALHEAEIALQSSESGTLFTFRFPSAEKG